MRNLQGLLLDLAPEHIVSDLAGDDRRQVQLGGQSRSFREQCCRIIAQPHVERFPLPHSLIECAQCFFQRRLRIRTVGIENIHMVET